MQREARSRATAPVLEVFASIQGEGAYIGEPQTFLRLRGCPLRCRWCDTPSSWRIATDDRVRVARVRRDARERSSDVESTWATPFQAACWIAEVEPDHARTVSVTGGEPLMWPEFLLGLRPMLGARRIHLETAGAHPETLASVIAAFDHVSLDLKQPLDLDPPEEQLLEDLQHEHAQRERSPRTRAEWSAARESCLALVRERDACAKLVVSGERTAADFVDILDQVEDVNPTLLVVVQPATAIGSVRAPSNELIDEVVELARARDLRVRVLPQLHRAMRRP